MARELYMLWTSFTTPLPILAVAESSEDGNPVVDERGYIKAHSPYIYHEVLQDSKVSDAQGEDVAQLGVMLVPLIKRLDDSLNVLHIKVEAFSRPIKDPQLMAQYKNLVMQNRARGSGLII